MTELARERERHFRILVPLDGSEFSEHALSYAVALGGPGAQILLLRVIPESHGHDNTNERHPLDPGEIVRQDRQIALESLLTTAAKVRESGDRVWPIASVAVGHPAEQITRAARDRGYDLIVMTSHGRGAGGRLVFGSVADEVSRTASVPVLIVRPPRDQQATIDPAIHRIVVPLDGSPLAEQALPFATEIAGKLDVPLLLLSVVDLWGFNSPSVMYPAGLNPRYYDQTMAEAAAEMMANLEEVASRLREEGITIKAQTLRAAVVPAILSATHEDDLIVMTSHAKSGITRFLLGSVAEKLVRESPTPVILVPSRVSETVSERVAVATTAGAIA